jgi:hypothetical protein
VRNETNIGGDRNIVRCVELAFGEYVWLFGDDELLIEGSIPRLMGYLVEYAPALVLLDSHSTVDRLFPNYRFALKALFFNDQSIILRHTLITATVFRRRLFNIEYAREMLPTSYSHVYALAGVMFDYSNENTILITRCDEPFFRVRAIRAPSDVVPENIPRKLEVLHSYIALGVGIPAIARYGLRQRIRDEFISLVVSLVPRAVKNIIKRAQCKRIRNELCPSGKRA